MHPGHPTISDLHAVARRRDLLAEAERDRQHTQARAARSIVPTFRAAARWAIGVQLIRIGERIQGAVPEPGARTAAAGC
jgi:hypothetical protein